jgi:hypothetical protein
VVVSKGQDDKEENHKHQITNHKQIPIPKARMTETFSPKSVSVIGNWFLDIVCDL